MRAYSYADPEGLVRINNNDEPQLDIAPGPHVVTVVDELGNRLARRFEILSAQD